jgi:hypothetical protein
MQTSRHPQTQENIMNKARRNALKKALPFILEAQKAMEKALSIVSDTKDEEKEAYDNLNTSMQEGDLGQSMEEAINLLEEITDSFDAIDLKIIAEKIAEVADVNCEEDFKIAKITEAEAEKRKYDRLPEWAKSRIQVLEKKVLETEEKLRNMFPDPDPEKTGQILIEDYGSPMRGKVLPAEMIRITGSNIRIYGERKRKGNSICIEATDMNVLSVRPSASNTIMVEAVDR